MAEKSSVFRYSGTCSKMAFMLSEKPMFSISSASSSTTLRMFSSFTLPRSMRSMSRPGVATMICAPCRSSLICVTMDAPPYTGMMCIWGMYLANEFRSSAICRHNSRVGLKMSACVSFVVASVFCNTGMPYAAVLPVPVCASAMTSLCSPNKHGITSSWTGIGCSNPSSSMARRIGSLTPNSSNVFKKI